MTLNRWSRRRSGKAQSRRLKLIGCSFLLVFAILSEGISGQSRVAAGQGTKADSKSSPSLAREIRHQLTTLPFYSVFDSITFSLDGKKVTLNGQVLRPMLKRNAVEAIKSLEGVEAVIDRIEVLPNSPTDDELRRGVYRAIFEDPELAPYAAQTAPPVHIVVKNGNVTLEGAVKSATHKNLAATRASGVTNVASVKNNLNVRAGQGEAEPGDVR